MTEGGEGPRIDPGYEARHKRQKALSNLEAEAAKVRTDKLAGSRRRSQHGAMKSILRWVLGR